jgi:hypothetical protein
MKKVILLVFIFCGMMIFSCGKDFAAEGMEAYNDGNYSDAIKLLSQALAEDSTNLAFKEKVCLSYFYRGEELYLTTKNVKTFSANFTEGQKFLPANPTDAFIKEYANQYVKLASAYASVKVKTEEEKDYYFDQALTTVKEVINLDSSNTEAQNLIVSLKESHFQGLIDKGKDLYNKARRTKNYDLFFSAEYYLKEAKKFEANNPQINDLLQKITAQTLPALNYREEVSIAVAGITHERKALIMNLSIKNYSEKPVNLLINNFTLVDTQGKDYFVNEHEMKKRELFGETCISDTILNNSHPMETGLIAFDVPDGVKIKYVNYQLNPQKSARKYFQRNN